MHEQQAKTLITVRADRGGDLISRHIYGHFAEHLGRCIYDGLYVGASRPGVSSTEGIRNDVIHALRNLSIPNLRWPGGCFADTYHWKDGIGPTELRPSIVNRWWGNVSEDNSFGTHEFLRFCELLGAEPYLAANVGSGTVQELVDWVQYVNFDGISPMSNLRKKNGRAQPWQVKFWGIGNEAWGCGGNMSPQHYANVYRQYVTFMSGWSNTEKLFRIASGANSDDYRWTETLMREIPPSMVEGLALHYYAVRDWNNRGTATGFTRAQYFDTMRAAFRMDELVTRHSAIMDSYDPGRKIALVVDEWGTWYDVEAGTNPGFLHQQNTMRDAIVAAVTLNIFNKHCGRVKMANLAQTVNVLQSVVMTHEEKMWLTPTYHVMEFYKVHHDCVSVPVEVKSGWYVDPDQAVPSISVSASRDQNNRVHLSAANIDPDNMHRMLVSIEGVRIESVRSRILVSDNVTDHNTVSNPQTVTPRPFSDFRVNDGQLEMLLPAASVCVAEIS